MERKNVGILFGGVSPEHEVSLRSGQCILEHLDPERFAAWPIGITKAGQWLLYGSTDYAALPDGSWEQCPENVPAVISPARGQGLLIFRKTGLERVPLDVVFPVLHGENGEDGSVQGLMQLAGIPCVGPGVGASAAAMDKTMTKLVADREAIPQAAWELIRREELADFAAAADRVEARFSYPVFVKPAGTGSSVGVSKVKSRGDLQDALEAAANYDAKILVEEFIPGQEVEVAVLGNESPRASLCGEIDSGVEFYDYEAKYITDTSRAYIPARISPEAARTVQETAVKIYSALGCRGLSRVDFFVGAEGKVTFNEINTIPGFTSISMYPKLWEASGLSITGQVTRLLELAMA
mgnify:CR=1 FL=1